MRATAVAAIDRGSGFAGTLVRLQDTEPFETDKVGQRHLFTAQIKQSVGSGYL